MMFLSFAHTADPEWVERIWPTTGPQSGATAVTVYGSSFLNVRELYCRFGTNTQSAGTYATSTAVRCVSAAHASVDVAVAVEVSLNNQQFTTWGVLYEYRGTDG